MQREGGVRMEQQELSHQALLRDRERLILSGVTGIDSYDDRAVIVYTQLGVLTVLGKDLQLGTFSAETGEASVTGDIQALRYGDSSRSAPDGILRRLLR